jgi:Major Facilitator Superfamily
MIGFSKYSGQLMKSLPGMLRGSTIGYCFKLLQRCFPQFMPTQFATLKSTVASIRWRSVGGLSAILMATTLSWMAYGLFQPQILQELGFVRLAAWLGVIQGLLGVGIEPMVGGWSDQIQQRYGSRLPLITSGVVLAGLIFAILAILLQGQIPAALRWIVPVLMSLWVVATIIFRGPVIALLRQAAPFEALPVANIALTAGFGIVGALEPLLSTALRTIGTSATFLLGAIILTIGATVLYTSAPPAVLFASVPVTRTAIAPQRQAAMFGLGCGVGLEMNLLLRLFPQGLAVNDVALPPNWIAAIILFISALVAAPLGLLAAHRSVKYALLGGLFGILVCLGILPFHPGGLLYWGVIALAGFSFGLVFESQIPLTLGLVPADRAGLGTGLYFGGIGAATAGLSTLFLKIDPVPITWGFAIVVIAFVLVMCCLSWAQRLAYRANG